MHLFQGYISKQILETYLEIQNGKFIKKDLRQLKGGGRDGFLLIL